MPRLTPERWDADVRARLRATRIARGWQFRTLRPRRNGWAAARIELQAGGLLLDSVFRLCKAYSIRPDYILDGWPGWSGRKTSAPPPMATEAELELLRSPAMLMLEVRQGLIARRHALGKGAPAVALDVLGTRTGSSTIFRLESGDTRRPDAGLVYRLLVYYDLTFAELLGLTPEVSCPPTPPPSQPPPLSP